MLVVDANINDKLVSLLQRPSASANNDNNNSEETNNVRSTNKQTRQISLKIIKMIITEEDEDEAIVAASPTLDEGKYSRKWKLYLRQLMIRYESGTRKSWCVVLTCFFYNFF